MIASHRSAMSCSLIIIGLAIAAVGSLWPWITRLGPGRLAGDIFIQRDNFRHCHVWTPLADQGLFLALRGSWVR
jgi:hypothetical protein